MTDIILSSVSSWFTVNIAILFTFISLNMVGYMTTKFLERLSNKKINHIMKPVSLLCFWLT